MEKMESVLEMLTLNIWSQKKWANDITGYKEPTFKATNKRSLIIMLIRKTKL